jgi:hypothetical protein
MASLITWTFHVEASRKSFRLFRAQWQVCGKVNLSARPSLSSDTSIMSYTLQEPRVSYANYWVTGSSRETQTEYRKQFSGSNMPADSTQSIDK